MTHPDVVRKGRRLPLETFYSSSTFGWTEHSENGFTAYVPYLRAVDDHWSQLPEVGNPYARWEATFSGDRLAALLPGIILDQHRGCNRRLSRTGRVPRRQADR